MTVREYIDAAGKVHEVLTENESTAADKVIEIVKPLPRKAQQQVLEKLRRESKDLLAAEAALGKELSRLRAERDSLADQIVNATRRAPIKVTFDSELAGTLSLPGIPDRSATLPRTLAEARAATVIFNTKRKSGEEEKFSHRWFALGFPTFEVTTGLASALCMTECRGILGRDFRTPFAAFAVQMPNPSPLVLADVGDVRFMLVDAHGRDVMVYAGDTARSGPLPAVADDEPIEQWIRKTAAPATHQGWTQIASFIVNLCVYIDSLHGLPPPEGRQRKPGASSKKRDHEPAPPQRWVLGRAIKLSPGMLQAARAAVLGERTAKQRAAYRLHVRFMVRGHWRNQAWGAKHEARRVRWIAPFWKGPELAEGLARLYAVDAPDGPPSTGVTK